MVEYLIDKYRKENNQFTLFKSDDLDNTIKYYKIRAQLV